MYSNLPTGVTKTSLQNQINKQINDMKFNEQKQISKQFFTYIIQFFYTDGTCVFVHTYRAHSGRVMLLYIGTKCCITGISPGVQRGLTLIRLQITGFLTQVIKTK